MLNTTQLRSTAIAAVGIAALALTLGACGSDGASTAAAVTTTPSNNRDTATITAVGHGKVVGTPDVMTISLGVQTGGPTAQAALTDNNTRARTLVNVLKERGVKPADIQTSELSVFPTYDEKGRTITGYGVTNTVTAKLRDIDAAGDLIDAVTFAVGDAVRLNGIAFSIDDTSKLVAAARADAVKQAMAQAEQLADAADVRLGAVRTIDETPIETSPPVAYAADRAALSSAPIERGSQDVTLDVKLVVEIDRG
jgi:uncharacterized protein YggE